MPYKDPDKQRAYQREWVRRNRPSVSATRRRSRDEIKQEIRNMKEATPCAECGKRYPYYVMDLDHCNGEKVMSVSVVMNTYGYDRTMEEVAKCEVVCSNCHRERTQQQAGLV